MKISSISLTLISITACVIEYFLLKGWRRYKNLRSGNNSASFLVDNSILLKRAFFGDQRGSFNVLESSISKYFFQLQILYFVALMAIGIAQLKSYLWVGGTVCIFLALIGFTGNIVVEKNMVFYVDRLNYRNPNKSPFLNKKSTDGRTNITISYLRYLWLAVFILLSFSIFTIMSRTRTPGQERVAAITWIASVTLGTIIIFWKRPGQPRKNISLRSIKNGHQGVLLLILVIVFGGFMRTFQLSDHPYPWSGDEASIGMEARRMNNGEKSNYFETGWSLQPNWSFIPTAIATRFLGDNMDAIRVTSVIAGTLAILFTYLAASEMFNPIIAMISAAFLATFPYHVHFSRLGVNNIMDSLMSSLVFWLIARSVRVQDVRLCYLAGAFGGLCVYTYAGTKLVLLLGVIILFFFLYSKQGPISNHAKYIFFFIVAGAISAVPQIVSLARGGVLLGRLSQEGILFNGWLAQQSAFEEIPVIQIIWGQLTKTLLAFIALPASGIFYYSPRPFLTIAASIFFLFGLSFSWTQRAKPEYFSLLIWYWAVVIIGGVLTKNPPAVTRMLMTTPAIAILIGIGVYKIIEYLESYGILFKAKLIYLAFAIMALLSVQNIYFYMVEFKGNSYFQDAAGEFAMEAGSMVKNLGDEYQIFIVGEPMVFSDFPTFEYLAPNNRIMNFNDKSIGELQLIEFQKYAFFAIPENHILLEKIMERYEGGRKGTFTRKIKEQPILFEYYILDTNH